MIVLLAALRLAAAGQETPAAGLEALGMLAGRWDYTAIRLPHAGAPVEETGRLEVEPILNGTYLRIAFQVSDRNGGARSGLQHLTYNPHARRYELLTLYAGSARRVLETGQFDRASRTLHLQGEYTAPGGAVESIRARIRLGESAMTYENDVQLPDGSWHTDYRADYRRSAKK